MHVAVSIGICLYRNDSQCVAYIANLFLRGISGDRVLICALTKRLSLLRTDKLQ